MSATAFQRARRVAALRDKAEELNIAGYEQMSEAELHSAVSNVKPEEVKKSNLSLDELRARAKELGIPKAAQLGEKKLLVVIAAKEQELAIEEAAKQLQELREKAAMLDIENVDEMDAEGLTTAITASEALQELREKATALGIENAPEMDAVALTDAIAEKGGVGDGN